MERISSFKNALDYYAKAVVTPPNNLSAPRLFFCSLHQFWEGRARPFQPLPFNWGYNFLQKWNGGVSIWVEGFISLSFHSIAVTTFFFAIFLATWTQSVDLAMSSQELYHRATAVGSIYHILLNRESFVKIRLRSSTWFW